MRKIAIHYHTFTREGYSSRPSHRVEHLGNWRYCHDERFDPRLVSVYDGEEQWVGPPGDLNWAALEGSELISHGAAFTSCVHETMVELGRVPALKLGSWHCSANLTGFLCNRRSLAEAAKYLLGATAGIPISLCGNQRAGAFEAGRLKEIEAVALGETLHCWIIWDKFVARWPEPERRLSDLTIRQSRRGVAIDTEKLPRYRRTLQTVLFYIEKSLPWIARGRAPTSAVAIAEECRKLRIPCPPIKNSESGEEEYEKWESAYRRVYPWVANVRHWLSINSVLALLNTIHERLRPDGTIDLSLQYFGAHTGRWSCGNGLNMQSLRKEPIYIREDYSVADTNEEGLREVIDVRSLFVPRDGQKFVICDLSQIEPRVLNWIVGNDELLRKLAHGMSIYEAYAREFMNWRGGDLKKEDPVLYKKAKACVLGLSYGCGAPRFKSLAKSIADLDLTKEEAQRAVAEFRRLNPSITALWNRLDAGLRRSRGDQLEIELPSGRKLCYPSVSSEDREFFTKHGKTRVGKMFTADIGGEQKKLYGALLTENLVQATSRDVFGEHLLALDRAGVNTVFSVHDEAVTEVPLDTDPGEIQEIMSRTPDWLAGCPIAAEAIETDHYTK